MAWFGRSFRLLEALVEKERADRQKVVHVSGVCADVARDDLLLELAVMG